METSESVALWPHTKQINVLCNLNRKMSREISWVSGVYQVIIALEKSDNFYKKKYIYQDCVGINATLQTKMVV
jgi:hypothetical protein